MGQACCATDSNENVIFSDVKAAAPQDKAPGFLEQPSVEQPVPAAVAAASPPAASPAADQAGLQQYNKEADDGAPAFPVPPPPPPLDKTAAPITKQQADPQQEAEVPTPEPKQPEIAAAATAYAGPEFDAEPKMVLLFKLPDDSFKEVVVRNRPLGLDFQRSSPICMKKVHKDSIGDKLGVQVGWELHSVNGEDVFSRQFEYTYKLLKEASTVLPIVDGHG
mmetsp:Transcript_24596/g.65384  ORF Transcript_24596/g.65384 Transcript_24596/m.65384 type:complete len:221 (+) Transcript_24596:56-718(+)